MPHIEHETREAIAAFLPDAIAAALQSYSNFLEEQATDDKQTNSAQFKLHHDACKVAVAHIELLLKLSKSLDIEDEGKQDELMERVRSAQKEITDNPTD